MILGDSSLIGGLDVGGAPGALDALPGLAPLSPGSGIFNAIPDTRALGTPVYTGPAYVWGLISIPTAPAPDGEAQGDPGLWIYLQFLKAFLQTDNHATALWAASGMGPGNLLVNAIRAHNPGDDQSSTPGLGVTTKDLPALYMWWKDEPDATTNEWIAEDWLIATSEVRLLWIFPEQANTAILRSRSSFVDALAKCIVMAIETGRTPSFIVPGDPELYAQTIGSFVHKFTSVFAINVTHWGASRVRITSVGDKENGESSTVIRRALEMRFEYKENLVKDPHLWSFPSALQQTVTDGSAQAASWGPVVAYPAGSYVVASPVGSTTGYIFESGSAGTTGPQPPLWPVQTGATVTDGSVTWTCKGLAGPAYGIVGYA